MTSAHEVVAAYWAAAEARDWDAFGALLADDVIYRSPQTREQVRGREAYIRFNVEGFRYDWHIAVQRIVGEGLQAASWIEFTGPEGTQPGLCFFDLDDDGRITQITDFWPRSYGSARIQAARDRRCLCLGSGSWRITGCLYATASCSWPSRTSRLCRCRQARAAAR